MITQSISDTVAVQLETASPSLVAILGLVLTGLIFPFVMYFFKKNERLHEETKAKVGEHAVTLGLHEYRLISLEEWRRLHTVHPVTIPPSVAPEHRFGEHI